MTSDELRIRYAELLVKLTVEQQIKGVVLKQETALDIAILSFNRILGEVEQAVNRSSGEDTDKPRRRGPGRPQKSANDSGGFEANSPSGQA